MMDSHLSSFLASQVTRVPMLFILLAGTVLAAMRWSVHPRVSLLAVLAFGLMAVGQFTSAGHFYWLIVREGYRSDGGRFLGILLPVIVQILELSGWILLLCALFGWRVTPEGRPGSIDRSSL